jgi:hypothetical protein
VLANVVRLEAIFTGRTVLRIPFFQRSYVWEKDQWERLIEDLKGLHAEIQLGGNPRKFMGALIMKMRHVATGEGRGLERELVDGQQRITTLVVMMKALAQRQGLMDEFDRSFKDGSGNLVVQHNLNDRDDFAATLDYDGGELPEGGRITELFKFMMGNEELVNFDWNVMFDHLDFVAIDLSETEDEQEIFDAINSLGVRLTTSELLKNYLYERNQEAFYRNTWMIEFEAEDRVGFWNMEFTAGRVTRTVQDVFFHAFLQVKTNDASTEVSSVHREKYSRVSGLFQSFRSFIETYEIDKPSLVGEIVQMAAKFRSSFDPDVLSRSISKDPGMERMNVIVFGLENSTVIPYLLYVLDKAEGQEIPKICGYLEAFLCRRLICKSESNNYNKLFTRELIGNEILTVASLSEFINNPNKTSSVNRMPSELEYRTAWDENKLQNKFARGVLYLLETATCSGNVSLNGLASYTLEHVMPKKWSNHWTAPSGNWNEESRKLKLMTLGNLTLLTEKLNKQIRDYDWNRKLEGEGRKKGLRVCSSGIEIMNDYLQLSDWDEEVIIRRANELHDKSLLVWSINPLES